MAKKIRIEGKDIRTELERIFSVPFQPTHRLKAVGLKNKGNK